MNLPNYITLSRIFLTPLFFTALVSYHPEPDHFPRTAFFLFLAAGLTDALDGTIARITKHRTALGTFLDPLADKILLLSAFLGLLCVPDLPYRPPLWITVTVVFRDLVILIGLGVMFGMRGKVEIKPNSLGKITTAVQMLTILTILLGLEISVFFSYGTAVLTIASCFSYIQRDFHKLTELP